MAKTMPGSAVDPAFVHERRIDLTDRDPVLFHHRRTEDLPADPLIQRLAGHRHQVVR